MNKLTKLALGLGMFLSSMRFSNANEINQLRAPNSNEVKVSTVPTKLERTVSGDYTFVTVPATSNTNQNALNVEEASQTPTTTPLLIVTLQNGKYQKIPKDNINVNQRNNVSYRAESSPIPSEIGRIEDFPSTGVFIGSEMDLGSSVSLQNFVFYTDRDVPTKFLDFKLNDYHIKECYFRGDNGRTPNQRGITVNISSNASTITVEHCLFTSFTYGSEISKTNTKWRRNIFKNNEKGWTGTAGADYGTTSSPGNNLFWKNRYIVEIGGGKGYPMQWGWFYNKDGIQLTKLEDILALIEDYRTTTTPSPSNFKSPNSGSRKLDVGSDVLIYPFHTDPHPLIPGPTSAKRWKHYR